MNPAILKTDQGEVRLLPPVGKAPYLGVTLFRARVGGVAVDFPLAELHAWVNDALCLCVAAEEAQERRPA